MQNPSKSTDFSPTASRYDATRNLPEPILSEAYRRLTASGILKPEARILDVGCGTGQLSLPLVNKGFQVTGIDLSAAMMKRYVSKLFMGTAVPLIVGDAQVLPFADGAFDVTVASKIFEHITNWKSAVDEILRVSKQHCILITERGHFGNAVRQQAQTIASELGHKNRFLGVIDKDELSAYFQAKGCQIIHPDTADLNWEEETTYGQALQNLRDGMFAEFWYLPEDDHQQMLDKIQSWLDSQLSGKETLQQLHPYLSIRVFSKAT